MKWRYKLIGWLGGIPVSQISTRTQHLPVFDYLVVRHDSGNFEAISGCPLLTIPLKQGGCLSVFSSTSRFSGSEYAIHSVVRIPRARLWDALSPYFSSCESYPMHSNDMLCRARRVVGGAGLSVGHQVAFDVIEALHNYPVGSNDQYAAQLTLEALYQVYTHYRQLGEDVSLVLSLESLMQLGTRELGPAALNGSVSDRV